MAELKPVKVRNQKAMDAMKSASVAVVIYKPGIEEDIQAAAFLGSALLMDKKIIIIAQTGVEIPEKVYFTADKVFRGSDPQAVVNRIEDWAGDLGVSEDAPIVVSP